MMALSAAVEPLRAVNRLVGEARYRWRIAARDAGPVAASNGLEVTAAHGLGDAPPSDLTVLVASLEVEDYGDAGLYRWLRSRSDGHRMVGAVSTGPLILARAGLLDGRRATIHWEMQRRLAEEFPAVQVLPDLYCVDDGIMTAAGGTAAMDMMLALISRREGRDLAADVAEQFLHGPVRAATVRQRQDVRWRYQVTDRRLVSAIRLMEESLAVPLRIARIADVVGISERQLERLFESAFGKKPSEFYMEIRLKQARLLLGQSTMSLERIAEMTGFSSPGHFSRSFKACYGVPPSAVRRHRRDANGGILQEVGGVT